LKVSRNKPGRGRAKRRFEKSIQSTKFKNIQKSHSKYIICRFVRGEEEEEERV
jgi:hypothetical protein